MLFLSVLSVSQNDFLFIIDIHTERRKQMISTNEGYTRLEYFSEDVAADKNRKEFDIKTEKI